MTKMLIALSKYKFIVSFILIIGTLSFPIWSTATAAFYKRKSVIFARHDHKVKGVDGEFLFETHIHL